MAQGILVTNPSGHILISSEVEGLHCAGTATYDSLLLSGLTDFPTFDDANTLSGRCVHRYRWLGTDTPVFFIKPANINLFHGILNQWTDGVYQWVDVIQSGGTSAPPTIYVFVRPRQLVASAGVGIQTRLPDGNVAFDSRLKPLAIAYAASVIPPTLPCDGGQPTNESGFAWNDTTLDFDFHCDTTYNSYTMPGTVIPSALAFSAPSVAQAVYTRQKNGYKYSSGTYGGQSHWSTAVWWAMYHQAYRLQSGVLQSGWCVYAAGYWFSSTWESGSWYDGGGSGGGLQNGDRPYNDKTINLTENVAIVVNADYYA